MYPITPSTGCVILIFCYFGAAEPPPAHGYGPPSPVHLDSNEVASYEQQYGSPTDSSNYAGFGSGSQFAFGRPSGGHARSPAAAFGSPYGNAAPSRYKGGKGGVSSSYVSIVHGPGGGGPSKTRPYGGAAKTSTSPFYSSGSVFHGANLGAPSALAADGKFGSSNVYANHVPGFGAAAGAGAAGSDFDFAASAADYSKGYEGAVSDEVGSYSSGGLNYVTFAGSKPSFTPSLGQTSRGTAYSTSNVNVNLGGGGGGSGSGRASGGHGGFHPPSFAANFKPSGAKTYNRYQSVANGGYVSGGGGSSSNGGGPNPLVGVEGGYASRGLKAGYTVDAGDHFNSAEDANLFSGFGDGAGFKVQSSYSSNT